MEWVKGSGVAVAAAQASVAAQIQPQPRTSLCNGYGYLKNKPDKTNEFCYFTIILHLISGWLGDTNS